MDASKLGPERVTDGDVVIATPSGLHSAATRWFAPSSRVGAWSPTLPGLATLGEAPRAHPPVHSRADLVERFGVGGIHAYSRT